ncbi:MAG: inner membrane protein YiaA [Pseudomonadales bacterium]
MTLQAPTKSFKLAAVLALASGIAAFAIGLFNADMLLNEKGYYLAILLYGLFAMVSLQKTVRDRIEGIPTSKIYYTLSWFSAFAAIALLAIGLYNAELYLSEKGFYAMAYILSLFAAITVQKNVRDSAAAEDQSPVVEKHDTTLDTHSH